MKKKVAAILLSIIMLMLIVPVSAFAMDNDIEGALNIEDVKIEKSEDETLKEGEDIEQEIDDIDNIDNIDNIDIKDIEVEGKKNIQQVKGTQSYDDFEYQVNGNEITITKYTGSEIDVIIPSEIDGIKVTKIGNEAFWFIDSIRRVVIPEGVTTIGENAFKRCDELVSIKIPDSVTTIEKSAFFQCLSLKSVTLPDGVTSIEDSTFHNCPDLESVIMSNSVTTIGNGAFAYCFKLKNITMPDYLTTIGEKAFWQCELLTDIMLPNGVTTIGRSAFDGCKSLKNITIPNSVTTIEIAAFWGCRSLENVTIPNSVTTIGGAAFFGCSSLKNIIIPNSVTTIGSKAFEDCSSLKNIIIPSSVKKLERRAFFNCSSLTNVIMLNNIMSLYDVFANSDLVTLYVEKDSFTMSSCMYYNIKYKEYTTFNKIESITLSDTNEIKIGESLELKPILNPENATIQDLEWESLNEDVVTVENGKITAKGVGVATVTATALDGSGVVGEAIIEVVPDVEVVPEVVENLKVKAGKKRAIVSYKKKSRISGYQIYRSTKKSSGFKLVKTTSSNRFTNKKLKSKKTYYYKVRAYKTINGKKKFGKYTSPVKVRIK